MRFLSSGLGWGGNLDFFMEISSLKHLLDIIFSYFLSYISSVVTLLDDSFPCLFVCFSRTNITILQQETLSPLQVPNVLPNQSTHDIPPVNIFGLHTNK